MTSHRSSYINILITRDYRPHAVCTVQTFMNSQSGACSYESLNHSCVIDSSRTDALHVRILLPSHGMEGDSLRSIRTPLFLCEGPVDTTGIRLLSFHEFDKYIIYFTIMVLYKPGFSLTIVFQLVHPSKYNKKYADNQVNILTLLIFNNDDFMF